MAGSKMPHAEDALRMISRSARPRMTALDSFAKANRMLPSNIAAKDKKLVAKLQADFGLGRGEGEAIVVALAEKARLIGIEDKNGINACKLLGIPFTTAIGILRRMCEKQLVPK